MDTGKERYLDIKNSLMFVDVFANNHEVLKGLLQTLLKIDIDNITEVIGENTLTNGINILNPRLDIYCESDNELIDIEMQICNRGDLDKRMRFYQSCMDSSSLKRGSGSYNDLKECYVVFLCGFDPYDREQTIYKIDRCITNADKPIIIDSQDHWLLFDYTAWEKCPVDTGATANLLKYIQTGIPSDELTNDIDKIVRGTNLDKKKVNQMITVQEDMQYLYDAGIAKGEARGIAKGEAKYARLVDCLLADKRFDELSKISKDANLLNKLYEEYEIQ